MSISETSCQFCRVKKVKCDRALPSCSRCERHLVECVYRGKLRSGPKKRKIELPFAIPMKPSNSSASSTVTNSSSVNHFQVVTPASLPTTSSQEQCNLSVFDIIPLPTAQALLQFFTSVPELSHNVGLTKGYLFSLLHKERYLLVSGTLALSCYMNLSYKKYFSNMYTYFQYQISNTTKGTGDTLEILQARKVLLHLQFLLFDPKQSLSTLMESINQLQFSNYQILDLVPDEQKNLPVTTITDGKYVNDEAQILDMKRKLYWSYYACDRYTTFGIALNGRIRPEYHSVDLPDSRLNMNQIKNMIFNSSADGSIPDQFIQFQCKSLTIIEYHYILLSKSEEVAMWFRKLDYIRSIEKGNMMKDSIVTQYHIFRKQLDSFESTLQFTDEQLNSFSYFAKIQIFLVVLRVMIKQGLIDVLDHGETKTGFQNSRLCKIQIEIFQVILTIKDKFKLEDIQNYHYDAFMLFQVYELLKILSFYSSEIISDDHMEVDALTNKLVTIITTLAYEYENDLAKKVLEDYNTILEKSLIHSLFYMDGIVDKKDNLSHFKDFINIEMNS